MISLTKEQILMLHQALISATGGSYGVRDEGMLDSALAAPFATFDDEEFFLLLKKKLLDLRLGL